MAHIDLSIHVKWFNVPEKDFTGIMVSSDPKEANIQIQNAPPLTFFKLISLMLLESVPLENGDITKKLLKCYDGIESAWNKDKLWKPTEDEIGKLEELLAKVKDERYKNGKLMGFVVKQLENYRKELIKAETK